MWVNNADNWSKDLQPLEIFLMERIIQRCDLNESISNKHRTSNGYTQVKELVSLCALSLHRSRTIKTVKVLIQEAQSQLLSQNIANDIIIEEYFSDLKKFIGAYDPNKLTVDSNQPNLIELNSFIHKLRIFESQLDGGYFLCLRKEFFKVDYTEKIKIERHASQIAKLVEILVPFLVFKGYAVSSLSEVLKSWVESEYKATAHRMFYFFNLTNRNYEYLIKVEKETEQEYENIMSLLEEDQKVSIQSGIIRDLRTKANKFKDFDDDQKVIIYEHENLDPHIHFRTIFDRLLKRLVQKRERQSLTLFNNLLRGCYWRIPKPNKDYHFVDLVNDPINVNSRGKTLRDTLIKSSEDFGFPFDDNTPIPIPKNGQLNNALYYYNLALGSKSIENSLSLLWTSLESLLTFRSYYSDIECVQDFVSKSLALGSIVRDIHAFGKRMTFVSEQNGRAFDEVGCNVIPLCHTRNGIVEWYNWITNMDDHEQKFDLLKSKSQLLAFEYGRVAKPLVQGKLIDLEKRIRTSHDSMLFQLQRIYLHRNQIIHSANLVNEYTNLWMHLEWYVGKLLAFAMIQIEITAKQKELDKVFIDVHADYDYVMSYLEKNRAKSMADISPRIKDILLNYSWQSF